MNRTLLYENKTLLGQDKMKIQYNTPLFDQKYSNSAFTTNSKLTLTITDLREH